MTRRAIAPYPEFELQPYEALRQEVSCSYQTMEYFHAQYPDDEFYFIIGADSLMAIESWVHPERLFQPVRFLPPIVMRSAQKKLCLNRSDI